MSEQSEAFGRRLRALREARGCSMVDLQRAAGISGKCDLWRWETGRVLPGFDALVRLSVSLEVSLDELMRGLP